ncbi:MAG TPA: hypothetical protein VLT59_16770 [Steroidobacteraceae bacterium]|nr:hypothetical protein [Steroidobacteraceae bacterium]
MATVLTLGNLLRGEGLVVLAAPVALSAGQAFGAVPGTAIALLYRLAR